MVMHCRLLEEATLLVWIAAQTGDARLQEEAPSLVLGHPHVRVSQSSGHGSKRGKVVARSIGDTEHDKLQQRLGHQPQRRRCRCLCVACDSFCVSGSGRGEGAPDGGIRGLTVGRNGGHRRGRIERLALQQARDAAGRRQSLAVLGTNIASQRLGGDAEAFAGQPIEQIEVRQFGHGRRTVVGRRDLGAQLLQSGDEVALADPARRVELRRTDRGSRRRLRCVVLSGDALERTRNRRRRGLRRGLSAVQDCQPGSEGVAQLLQFNRGPLRRRRRFHRGGGLLRDSP